MVDEYCKDGCEFDNFPTFDANEAKGLSTEEVRKRWPRKMLYCRKCNQPTLCYASYEHYIYGDW